MPRENDMEGLQDQGGKHGGQKGMPKPEPKPPHGPDPDIPRDGKAGQPRHKACAAKPFNSALILALIRPGARTVHHAECSGRPRCACEVSPGDDAPHGSNRRILRAEARPCLPPELLLGISS